jgi:hypothetical protein
MHPKGRRSIGKEQSKAYADSWQLKTALRKGLRANGHSLPKKSRMCRTDLRSRRNANTNCAGKVPASLIGSHDESGDQYPSRNWRFRGVIERTTPNQCWMSGLACRRNPRIPRKRIGGALATLSGVIFSRRELSSFPGPQLRGTGATRRLRATRTDAR